MCRTSLAKFGILIALGLLTGCGFSPIYGSRNDAQSHVADQLNQVSLANIPDRVGQMLRNDLIDRMYRKGRPAHPSYRLEVALTTSEEDLGILADATTTRTLLTMGAHYTLKDLQDKVLSQGDVQSVAGFNKLSQQYGTQSAREGAIDNTVNEVSNQIVARLSLYFAEKSTKQ